MNKDYTIIGLVIVIIFLLVSLGNRKSEIEDLWAKIEDLQANNAETSRELDGYQSALDEANANIEDANSQINNAKDYEDTNYEDMSSVLTELYEVDTVSAP